MAKNTLDGIELPGLAVLKPSRLLAHIRRRLHFSAPSH